MQAVRHDINDMTLTGTNRIGGGWWWGWGILNLTKKICCQFAPPSPFPVLEAYA